MVVLQAFSLSCLARRFGGSRRFDAIRTTPLHTFDLPASLRVWDAGRGRTHAGARDREPARAARVRRDVRAHPAPAAQARGHRRACSYVNPPYRTVEYKGFITSHLASRY